jgi:hypothetical protein
MIIPGFTGEASLYRSSIHFQHVGWPTGRIGHEGVVPQQGPDCFWSGACYYCCDPPGSQNCTAVACIA